MWMNDKKSSFFPNTAGFCHLIAILESLREKQFTNKLFR